MSVLIWAILIFCIIAVFCGALLGYASIKLKVESDPITEQIDELLPQSQCGQCGYPGCHPYAEAITNGDEINKCVPGGQGLIIKIADLMGVEPPQDGDRKEPVPMVALINEDMCIGCTKCIQACPVDAIIGSNKAMHTVIPDLCTGCELCVAPCPTDCITMEVIKMQPDSWDWKYNTNMLIPIQNVPSNVAYLEEITGNSSSRGKHD